MFRVKQNPKLVELFVISGTKGKLSEKDISLMKQGMKESDITLLLGGLTKTDLSYIREAHSHVSYAPIYYSLGKTEDETIYEDFRGYSLSDRIICLGIPDNQMIYQYYIGNADRIKQGKKIDIFCTAYQDTHTERYVKSKKPLVYLIGSDIQDIHLGRKSVCIKNHGLHKYEIYPGYITGTFGVYIPFGRYDD